MLPRRYFLTLFVAVLAIPATCLAAPAAPDAQKLLQKSDEIRMPSGDYTLLARVTSHKPGKEPTVGIYEVMAKGKDKSVIKTIAPPADKGRLLLLRDINLWAYLPNISKPIRISLRERLIGDVANADIARANFAGDYTAVIARTEIVEKTATAVLDLTARNGQVAYAKVRLWVASSTGQPAKAEFYGLSGRLLKSCKYERLAQLGGRMRPSRIIMSDPLKKGQFSLIEYAKMEPKTLPEKYFTDDYMKKLSVR